MSYGIVVKNGFGKTIVNSEDPILQYSRKATLSLDMIYTSTLATAIWNHSATSWYAINKAMYSASMPAPEKVEFALFEVKEGNRVHVRDLGDSYTIYSDSPAVRVAFFKMARNIPARPSGHGIVVRDAMGRQVWTDHIPMLEITGTPLSPGGGTWFHIESGFVQLPHANGFAAWRGFKNDGGILIPEIMQQITPNPGRTDMFDPFRGFVANINYPSL